MLSPTPVATRPSAPRACRSLARLVGSTSRCRTSSLRSRPPTVPSSAGGARALYRNITFPGSLSSSCLALRSPCSRVRARLAGATSTRTKCSASLARRCSAVSTGRGVGRAQPGGGECWLARRTRHWFWSYHLSRPTPASVGLSPPSQAWGRSDCAYTSCLATLSQALNFILPSGAADARGE